MLRADTYGGFALLRSNLKSHAEADVAAAVAYGKRAKVYALVAVTMQAGATEASDIRAAV